MPRPPRGRFLTHRGFNAVMESFFSPVKSELGEHFDSNGEAKMELFDYIEVFYNQRRRHSTIGQISPAVFERRAVAEGLDAMDNRRERGCVQQRLARTVGVRPTEATVRRLVAWVAGRKEIEFLKPTDKAIHGMVSESSGPGRSRFGARPPGAISSSSTCTSTPASGR